MRKCGGMEVRGCGFAGAQRLQFLGSTIKEGCKGVGLEVST